MENEFYPIVPKHKAQVDFHLPKLKCMKSGFNVYGDFETVDSTFLAITHSSCDFLNNANCKSQEEVQEWLKHKYAFIVYT